MNTFNEIIKLVKASKSTVILTGAGISTESGLPAFRSDNGFWTKNKPIQLNEFLQAKKCKDCHGKEILSSIRFLKI